MYNDVLESFSLRKYIPKKYDLYQCQIKTDAALLNFEVVFEND